MITEESRFKKAVRLLRDAKAAIGQELGAMDEEEQSQPIPAAHGKVYDRIEAFLNEPPGFSLTRDQLNFIRYALEYKLEQDESGDGINCAMTRRMVVRLTKKICALLKQDVRFEA